LNIGLKIKIIFLCLLLQLNTIYPSNIPNDKNSDSKITAEFAIAADKNYKTGGIIRRYVSGAGLFVVIIVEPKQILNL